MVQNINLIPEEEVTEQYKTNAVKVGTVFSIILLIIVVVVSGYLIFLGSQVRGKIGVLDTEIAGLRVQIQNNSALEIKARNLDKKFTSLTSVFSTQYKFSKLLQEIRARKPETLEIVSFDLKDNKMNISGKADTYISIADFVNNLVNSNFTNGIKGLEGVFTSVSLNSVNLQGSDRRIEFLVVVQFDKEKLK